MASNLADALKTAGFLPASFPYASGNYAAIQEVLAPFGFSDRVAGLLFAGVILWEGLAATLFWRAGLSFQGFPDPQSRRRLILAFAVSLGLWGAFQLACEALPSPVAYRIEGTHRLLFIATLATLLSIALLPED